MKTSRLLAIVAVSTIAIASSMAAQTVIPIGEFQSVETRNGAHVLVRHGNTQRVSILTGDARCASIRLADEQRLLIKKLHGCGRNQRLQIEIITPALSALAVSNGGTLQTVSAFPAIAEIDAAVDNGGTLDIRSIRADAVHASVEQGGRILTHPRSELMAAVVHGGSITYWGDVRVRKSVLHGGVVQRGTPADVDKPLSDFGHSVRPPIAPVPPVAPVPPRS